MARLKGDPSVVCTGVCVVWAVEGTCVAAFGVCRCVCRAQELSHSVLRRPQEGVLTLCVEDSALTTCFLAEVTL